MREFKVGDWVIYTNKKESDEHKDLCGISLYGELAKVHYIGKFGLYLLEFKKHIKGHDGSAQLKKGKGKNGHCIWCFDNEFKLAIDHLKFKKWIKG